MSYRTSLIVSFLLVLPMGLLISAIAFGISPLEDALKSLLTADGEQLNAFGWMYIGAGLLGLPAALAVSLWPMLKKGMDGRRHVNVLNLALLLIALVLLLNTWGAFAEETYRCDVLRIPNCD